MKNKKIIANKHIKFIISTIAICSVLISSIAFVTINDIQSKLDKNYTSFAQDMTQNFALKYAELEQNTDFNKKISILKNYSTLILNTNKDILFIEFRDENNNLVYSSKKDFPINEEDTFVSVSSPVITATDNNLIGSVSIGMNGNKLKSSTQSAKNILIEIFAITGIAFALLIFFNMFLLTKEMDQLHKAVKQISTGKFGYKLESENLNELADAFNDMSTLLSKYEEQNIEQLTLERNKLEAVLMSIINGVIVCDNFDKVVLANSASLSMLDVEENQFLNTKIQDFIDTHGQKCFLEKIEEFKDTPLNIIEQKPIEFNIEAGTKTIKAMISPMFSKQQDYVGYIIVLIDITRETEVNKLKNTFISNVSHELRTPVTVLRTYIDTLYNNGVDFDEETKKDFLKTIDTEARRLHTMVNDILDFSRLESGKANVRKEYSNLSELLEQNIKSIQILAEEKNMKIIYNNETELKNVPLNVESMDRVIRNLLSNAIKYSNENTDIIVKTGITEEKDYAWFSIKDNGIGISKENLGKIFDRFYRVENATHTVKGTGLGLHLVKMTIEQYHHGKITVESKENVGSTFTVYLPLNIAEEELA